MSYERDAAMRQQYALEDMIRMRTTPQAMPIAMTKSPGQIAYEADVLRRPLYHDGTPRKQWSALDEIARSSWERDPAPRAP